MDEEGKIRTYLLMSKARVAPLKVCTIPRLELSAAALAVQMNTLLLSELEVPMDAVFFWTDSISTLRYIQNKTSRFQTFVANRLSIIHAGSNPDQWDIVWKKWTREYLPQLQQWSKWTTKQPCLKPGDVGMLADSDSPRGEWPMARVMEAEPGRDGLVRTVTVKARGKTIIRAVSRLCPLELHTPDERVTPE